MNYQETTNWMFNQLPMYQTQGASAYKKDLTNTILLVNHLNNPQEKIKCIHVAGTNGKGSTSHMLASILQEAGYKVGLYTSPHLKDFRERIKINGVTVSENFVCDFINTHKVFFEENDIDFENETIIGIDPFATIAYGGIKLKVHPNDEVTVKEILKKLNEDDYLKIV